MSDTHDDVAKMWNVEGVDVEDAADRAQRKRKHGVTRIEPREIGFWPGNRGGTGINSKHVHEIARDIMLRKCRPSRYEPVELLAVPEHLLKKFKASNKEKCDSDPLMPAFSPHIKYVAAGKTHFSHACKLAIDGSHTLNCEPKAAKIRFRPDDAEGRLITTHGVLAMVYEESLWDDPEAIEALSSLGNFNAAIDQGEDEMQAFGRIHALITRMGESPEWTKKEDIPVSSILESLKNSSGFGHFSVEEWKHLISLRNSLPLSHTRVLIMCQFNSVSGRIKLRSCNFHAVSKLDRGCSWIKVGLMLYGYQISSGSGSQPSSSAKGSKEDLSNVEFVPRSETYASNLSSTSLQQLQNEVHVQRSFEKAIKKSLIHYGDPDLHASGGSPEVAAAALLDARGKYLSKCGSRILTVLQPLVELVKAKKAVLQTLLPDERETLIDRMKLDHQFAKLETHFRAILLESGVYTSEKGSMPERLTTVHVEKAAHSLDEEKTKEKDASKKTEKEVAQPLNNKCFLEGIGNALELTQQDLFDRCSISGIGKVVMACVDIDTDPTVGEASEHVKDEKLSDDERMPDEQPSHMPTWRAGILRKLELPWAHVEIKVVRKVPLDNTEKGPDEKDNTEKVKRTEIMTFRIHESKLRAKEEEQEQPPQEQHPSLQPIGVLLSTQDFDLAERDNQVCQIMQSITDLVIEMRQSSSCIQIFRQSPISTLPLSLLCKATESFAINTLLLIPGNSFIQLLTASGEAAGSQPSTDGLQQLARDSGAPGHEKNLGKTKKLPLHNSMLLKVCGSIQEAVKDGRCRQSGGPAPRVASFECISPLMKNPPKKGQAVNTARVHPFWAVIKCSSAKSVHNMELVQETFVVHQAVLKGSKKSGLQKTITLPVLRNVEVIERGDVLTVPYNEDGDEE